MKMLLPSKKYYSIKEVTEHFNVSIENLLDYAVQGLIQLSVHLSDELAHLRNQQKEQGEKFILNATGRAPVFRDKETSFCLAGYFQLHKRACYSPREVNSKCSLTDLRVASSSDDESWYRLLNSISIQNLALSVEQVERLSEIFIQNEQEPGNNARNCEKKRNEKLISLMTNLIIRQEKYRNETAVRNTLDKMKCKGMRSRTIGTIFGKMNKMPSYEPGSKIEDLQIIRGLLDLLLQGAIELNSQAEISEYLKQKVFIGSPEDAKLILH